MNPVQGVAAAEELVNAQGVVAIVGALASGVTIPVATSVTIPNGIVQISGASTAPAITVLEDNDFLFRTALSDASQGVVLAGIGPTSLAIRPRESCSSITRTGKDWRPSSPNRLPPWAGP